jgi:hypothetical protein
MNEITRSLTVTQRRSDYSSPWHQEAIDFFAVLLKGFCCFQMIPRYRARSTEYNFSEVTFFSLGATAPNLGLGLPP